MSTILVSNDDGVSAPGLLALARAMQPLAERVQVVAPAYNQSAMGHRKTLYQDIRTEARTLPGGIPALCVHGSPADCIALAALGMADWPPRLVVSGVNRGANLSQDVVYSGTVAAALEATIQGVPALAVSLDNHDANDVEDYAEAARVAAVVARWLLQRPLPPTTILSLNVPNLPRVHGLRLTRQGVRTYHDALQHLDGGVVRIVGEIPSGATDVEGTDLWAVHHGYASLTPLHLDMTAYPVLSTLDAWAIDVHADGATPPA